MGAISKYYKEYLNAKSIFAFDLLLSLICSAIALLLLNYATYSSYSSLNFTLFWLGSSTVAMVSALLIFKNHRVVIRHASLRDFSGLLLETLFKGVIICVSIVLFYSLRRSFLLAVMCDVTFTFFALLSSRIAMVWIYDLYKAHVNDVFERKRVLVFGTSDKSAAVITRLQNSSHYRVLGLLSDDLSDSNYKLNNLPVHTYSNFTELEQIVYSLSLSAIIFCSENEARRQEDGLLRFCLKHKLDTLVIPSVEEVAGGKLMHHNVRKVKIEDLLGRDEIKISMDEIRVCFKDKCVLVTGAAGSIGSELCRQLSAMNVGKIVLFDNAETPMHNVRLELEERFPQTEIVPIIGDVRSRHRLDYAFRKHKPAFVFHAAAYKHVPLMEENPCEAVMVNVAGTRNVADKCVEYGIEKMVMISTDKAVNPTNIMGCSKRLAEIYVQSLAQSIEQKKTAGNTKFVTARFGNVLGSNGSVIPRFREQIEKGGPITVTHPEINRFFMTIPEACRLVMEAAAMGISNRIFVFNMGQPVKIVDLARRMIELSGLEPGRDIDIEFTGLRPGEKLYEEVLADTESTDPTSHDRIRIARVRDYDYDAAKGYIDKLSQLSADVLIPDMVRLMKRVVPEFKSVNSIFSEYDQESQN